MGEKTKGRYKTALGINVFLFFGTLIVSSVLMFSGNAFAAEAAAETSSRFRHGRVAAALLPVCPVSVVVSPYPLPLPLH